MFKRIVVLVLALTFMLSVSFAFAQPEAGRRGPPGQQGDINKIDTRVSKLTQDLNLTAKQQTKVKQILTKARDDANVILQEAKTKEKEIRAKADDDIKAILTGEQKNKFEEIRKNRKAIPAFKE